MINLNFLYPQKLQNAHIYFFYKYISDDKFLESSLSTWSTYMKFKNKLGGQYFAHLTHWSWGWSNFFKSFVPNVREDL